MTATEETTNETARTQPRASTITIRLTFQETPVDIALVDADIRAVERIITSTIGRPGWKPAKPPAMGFGGPRKPQTPPIYAADGSPCCPHHKALLRQKDFGWCCPQRLEPGDPHANERGYCRYVWRDGK